MDEKRKSEIAWILLKRFLAKDLRLSDIADIKRDLGNVAKETGISLDELSKFSEFIIGEIVDNQIAKLKGFSIKIIS